MNVLTPVQPAWPLVILGAGRNSEARCRSARYLSQCRLGHIILACEATKRCHHLGYERESFFFFFFFPTFPKVPLIGRRTAQQGLGTHLFSRGEWGRKAFVLLRGHWYFLLSFSKGYITGVPPLFVSCSFAASCSVALLTAAPGDLSASSCLSQASLAAASGPHAGAVVVGSTTAPK